MAYVKNTWVDQKVQRPKTYNFTTNDDGSTTLIDAFGNVEELGTPVNADNMNHIEDGLANVGIWTYSATVEYNKDDAVIGIVDNEFVLYKSKQDKNKGNNLSDTDYWEEVKLGGGGGLEVCDIGMALFVDETEGLRRRLNGQIVDINTNTQGFLTRLKQITTLYPSLLCTEEEWQTIKSASKLGQCGKFVFNYSGVEITSVRIPAVVNINGLADMANAGLIKDESLPNIKQNLGRVEYSNNASTQATIESKAEGYTFRDDLYGDDTLAYITFNANNTNSVYKDNAPIQQEAIQYPYFIQIATGQETEVNIKDTLELNNPFTFGMNMYFKGEMENISWLKSANQQNPKALCPDFYNWVLTNANAGKDGFKLSIASDITDYDYVINTTNETFRLPLKNHSANDGNSNLNLYYYVGETVQNADLIDAGRIGENLASKLDIPPRYPVEISDKSLMPSWYVVYNDGWCEQGGHLPQIASNNNDFPVTFLKPYKDANYWLNTSKQIIPDLGEVRPMAYTFYTRNRTSTGFTTDIDENVACEWEAKGYVS